MKIKISVTIYTIVMVRRGKSHPMVRKLYVGRTEKFNFLSLSFAFMECNISDYRKYLQPARKTLPTSQGVRNLMLAWLKRVTKRSLMSPLVGRNPRKSARYLNWQHTPNDFAAYFKWIGSRGHKKGKQLRAINVEDHTHNILSREVKYCLNSPATHQRVRDTASLLCSPKLGISAFQYFLPDLVTEVFLWLEDNFAGMLSLFWRSK